MEEFVFGFMDVEGESYPLIEVKEINIPDISNKIVWLMTKYGFDEASAQACLDWHELIQKKNEV